MISFKNNELNILLWLIPVVVAILYLIDFQYSNVVLIGVYLLYVFKYKNPRVFELISPIVLPFSIIHLLLSLVYTGIIFLPVHEYGLEPTTLDTLEGLIYLTSSLVVVVLSFLYTVRLVNGRLNKGKDVD